MRNLVINFRNKAQVVLYECELKGQISDGNWENSRPMNHWHIMCDAKAKVNPKNLGTNFFPKRSYNFANRDLVDVVGDRMIAYVRTKKAFPKLKLDDHFDWGSEYSCEDLKKMAKKDKYWKKVVKTMEKAFGMKLEKAYEKIGKVAYSKKDLMKDLKDMNRIVKKITDR